MQHSHNLKESSRLFHQEGVSPEGEVAHETDSQGSSVIFEYFFKSVFPNNLLGLPPPPPPDFRTKKKFDGHPNVYVYQYVLEHPYKLYAGPLVDSTPLHHYHQPDSSSLRYVYRALSPRTPAMLFRS